MESPSVKIYAGKEEHERASSVSDQWCGGGAGCVGAGDDLRNNAKALTCFPEIGDVRGYSTSAPSMYCTVYSPFVETDMSYI